MTSDATIDKLRRAREIIDRRYCEALDVPMLAGTVGLSRAHFIREFHHAFGQSPHQYIVRLRMERAAALLRTTDVAVAEICRAIGWQSVGSFTTRFTRTHGLSPTAYRSANADPRRGAHTAVRTPDHGRPRRLSVATRPAATSAESGRHCPPARHVLHTRT